MEDPLRKIPQISKILNRFAGLYPEPYVKRAAREITERYRKEIREGRRGSVEGIYEEIEKRIEELRRMSLRRVVNATGVVINTNLGRAPLPHSALALVEEIAVHYSNLEYDLRSGSRGSREAHVESYLLELTGAESALVVNNNAGAVLLVLNTLAKEREVVISRGELVEIGGSFRIPDIMRTAGALLREVGTTNRTRLSDYESAVGESTALIVKVHRSNFYMGGFTEEVSVEELAQLAERVGVPLYCDAGSGLLRDVGLGSGERTLGEYVSAGADLVSGSGDKLLGGPQAGIVVGRRDLVERLRRNPLLRALRVDKMTLAALEAVLRLHVENRLEEIPVIRMLTESEETLRRRARRLSKLLKGIAGLEVRVVKESARPGGGAFPELTLPTCCVALSHREISSEELSRRLRLSDPPVVGRLKRDTLLLDMRTVSDGELELVLRAVRKALQGE